MPVGILGPCRIIRFLGRLKWSRESEPAVYRNFSCGFPKHLSNVDIEPLNDIGCRRADGIDVEEREELLFEEPELEEVFFRDVEHSQEHDDAEEGIPIQVSPKRRHPGPCQ
jgi:hypothetical protein